ncbi:phage head spike fiber domain-containing protein [Comamonas thiooxydans]|uniref:phage head spike fiber domain-containing protein n=1 Tax=Comamonas thiooxydans TaxID=363952 RepID=UPI0021153D06|nr:hypothetical protein [Comamonas thiooxydans]UUE95347.1 hypothetical protein MJ608_06825 [Comamonas thiooxydans]
MSVIADLPDIRPSLLLDFANSRRVDPRIQFTRASSATCFGPDGLLRTVGVGVPRIDYDPATKACLGLLIEESRTNLIRQSAGDSDKAPWNKGVNLTRVGGALAPDGTNSATTYSAYAVGNAYIGQSHQRAANTTYTASCYARLRSGSVPTGGGIITVDYNADGNPAEFERVILPFEGSGISSEWKRFSLTFSNVSAYTASTYFCTDFNPGTEIDLWGCQLEVGSFRTSYIPTTDSEVTRAADYAEISGSSFSSWYRKDQSSVFMEASCFTARPSQARQSLSFSDGIDNNIIIKLPRPTGLTGLTVTNSGIPTTEINGKEYSAKTFLKIAAAFSEKNWSLSDGGGVYKNTSGGVPKSVDRLLIGSYGGIYQNGHIKRISYYPVHLSDAQLQRLTS